ncbi:DUF3035 domain-containing protein [Candidatus Pelagibacter sp.]|nr:DUF3035 domain-containing protein [Candidatus Pelagibacter sp.]
MKKNNPLIKVFLFLLFLNSCSSITEGLGGGKQRNSDEFLVKKKAPLVLPPDFEQLPEPGVSPGEDKALNTLSIEEIIGQSETNKTSTETNSSNSSIEKSIIEKINKQ